MHAGKLYTPDTVFRNSSCGDEYTRFSRFIGLVPNSRRAVIMILRIYALYNRSLRVGCSLLFTAVCVAVVGVVRKTLYNLRCS